MFYGFEHRGFSAFCATFIGFAVIAGPAHAQPLPGPADIDQVKPAEQPRFILQPPSPGLVDMTTPRLPDLEAPTGAANISFTPIRFEIEGSTVFSQAELAAIYAPYLGKETTVDVIWTVANAITAKYRDAGYFLSRAYVPAQEVSSGAPIIRIVEGYVGEIVLSGTENSYQEIHHAAIDRAFDNIKRQRPISAQVLERELLLLNDLPGLSFQSVLEPAKNNDQAAVRLALIAREKPGTTILSADNAGSRYLGPYQFSASWRGSLLPLQETLVTVVSAPIGDEMKAVSAEHRFTLSTQSNIYIQGAFSDAAPGYFLRPQDIVSRSFSAGAGVNHQLIRQRNHNVSLQAGFNLRNSDSDIVNTTLSKDRVRTIHASLFWSAQDSWLGYNDLSLGITQGLGILGSSKAGDIDASRQGAAPDFTKAQFSYARIQRLSDDWSGVLSLSGQKASRSLYSSEEFGYGGASLGRAYDTSEIVGDDGLAGGIEARYQGMSPVGTFHPMPYGFYDLGKVWNKNTGQEKSASGSSAGIGLYLQGDHGFFGNAFAAFPLTKSIETPLYGGNTKNPRYVIQISYKF